MPVPDTPLSPTSDLSRALGEAGEEEYAQLVSLLGDAQGWFALILVRSDFTPALRDALLTRLAEDISPVCVRVVRVTRQANGPVRALVESAKSVPEKSVLVLIGLENTPDITIDGGERKRLPAFSALNHGRETLRRTCPMPILVWCSEWVYHALREHAPDFFDHFTSLFTFRNAEAEMVRPLHDGQFLWERVTRLANFEESAWMTVRFYEQELAMNSEPTLERAHLLNSLGNAYIQLHTGDLNANLQQAIACYEESLAIFRTLGDQVGEGQTLTNLGVVYYEQGHWDEAIGYFQRSLAIFCTFGDRQNEGIALNNLGNVYDSQGRWEEAIACYEQSLVIRREFGDRVGEGVALNNLGNVYQRQGRWEEAIACYEQSLVIKREFGDRVGEGQTLNNLGMVYDSQGRWEEAIACYEQTLAICREFGDRVGEGQTLNNLGNVYDSQGRWEEAIACYEQTLAICREFGDRVGEGQTLENIALLHAGQNDFAMALQWEREALRVLETTQDVRAQEKAIELLARWERQAG